MTTPAIPLDVHHRYGPEMRDRILEKLQASMRDPTYRLLTPNHIKSLASIESPDRPVLSVYLRLSPERRARGAWRSAFINLRDATLGRVRERAARDATEQEFARIAQALEAELPALGRGAAFFVCRRIGLWRQIALALPLRDCAHLGPRPFVLPLVWTRDEHDRFTLVVLSQQKSRFFVSQIGVVQEVLRVKSDRLGRMLGGRIENNRRDDVMNQAIRNEARVLARAAALTLAQFDGRYLLLAGPPTLRAAVVQDLGTAIQRQVGGVFAADIHASPFEIATAAEPAQRAVEQREEVAAVRRLIDAGPAASTWGVGPTLDALRDHRVMMLAVDGIFGRPGARCGDCGALSEHISTTCAGCGGAAIEVVDDVIELAIEQALQQGAAFELVCSEAARALMDGRGAMAALLRW